ncbi:hypothetical protein GLW07_18990 [Bacillus hwajinpoensis]|uniref:Cthe-2314-like HEPN domain-containing protein n=2 Tax=Guptibacillus hwajinpoensis TaxID=208199 RepID=A0A845F3R8_9BACL|nr:hypothetical protein [Pseudalkalibacillus hwajinpoensis]
MYLLEGAVYMTIYIKPFEGIEKVDIQEHSGENPLFKYELPKDLFTKEGGILQNFKNIDMGHWEHILNSRILSVNTSFAYAMNYYDRGIPDEEWFKSPGKKGKSVQFFPNFEDEHYSNQYNFNYFVDTFFLKAYTIFETIGHLLYKMYEQEDYENRSNNFINFKGTIYKIKNDNKPLFVDLVKIKKSDKFKRGTDLRNDIAHNHPPYTISSGVNIKGRNASYGIGDYVTSSEIKEVMIKFLESIKETIEILHKHLGE